MPLAIRALPATCGAMPQAVVFDLFETLVTEYDPNWTHAQSIPSQLAVPDTLFTTAWAAMRRRRMLGQGPDTATALRMICDSAGVQADAAVIDRLTIHRKKAKAEPIMRLEPAVLALHRKLKAALDPHGIFGPRRLAPDF